MNNAVLLDVTPCGSCKEEPSEECIVSIIRAKKINELGATLGVTIIPSKLASFPSYR
jgi:hypothetical protein